MEKPILFCLECNEDTKCYWKNVCGACAPKYFQHNFGKWTSGNANIDKFIQHTQLSAKSFYKTLEWLPYDQFYDIEYIAEGGFGKVYRAKWKDKINTSHLPYLPMEVALKSLKNSKNVTLEFMNEIALNYIVSMSDGGGVIPLYGITQEPHTKNYMMVLAYACNGNIRNFLKDAYDGDCTWLRWYDRIQSLRQVTWGLKKIHASEIIHRDLHIGNILHNGFGGIITDMGLCKPANYDTLETTKKNVYGVLPYVAPEILRGQDYTKAADIYSFGIITYEVLSGLPPYHDVSHDKNLAIKICLGLRPRFNIKVPQTFVHLVKRCLDANPLKRPTAEELENLIEKWSNDILTHQEYLDKQMNEAEEYNIKLRTGNASVTSSSYEIHFGAIYTSRLLDFDNLPEPKNSDDYYEQSYNIISREFSESFQIDISRLNINDETSIPL